MSLLVWSFWSWLVTKLLLVGLVGSLHWFGLDWSGGVMAY